MIKNPKLNQKVYFTDDKGQVCQGRISQIYNDPSVGVDNFIYLNKAYIFPTRSRAEKYVETIQELDYLIAQRNFFEKQIRKFQTKHESFLK